MGRAIVREAEAFLFDEPLSNLDAKLRGQMRTEIARMQRRLGTTTVYVTHDQTEAMTLGDRVAVLRKGELQQVASPRGLYEQPVNLFVAGFIGSPPMNFLPGEVSGSTMKLPFADVPISADLASKLGDKKLVIVGIRPEHFEDANLLEESKVASGVTFDRARGRQRVARLGALRVHPVRDQPRRRDRRSRSSTATSTARACAPSSSSRSGPRRRSATATTRTSGSTPRA